MGAGAAGRLGPDAVRPVAATASYWAYLAAASLNAIIGIFVIVRAVAVADDSTLSAPWPALVGVVLVSFVYAAAVLVLARRFHAGATWARTTLFIVSLLALLAANGPGLFVVMMLALANLLAFLRPVTAWLRARDGLRPA